MADRDGVDVILEQWRRERPELDPSPIGVIGRISRLARELEQRLEAVYRQHGLEPGWHDVLATLRRTGPPYQLRPTEFAGTLMLTSSGTTKRLDRLEQAGLITRAPDPDDRRATLITLTGPATSSSTRSPRRTSTTSASCSARSRPTSAGAWPTSCASSSSACRRSEPRPGRQSLRQRRPPRKSMPSGATRRHPRAGGSRPAPAVRAPPVARRARAL
jgi:hypothetical protein